MKQPPPRKMTSDEQAARGRSDYEAIVGKPFPTIKRILVEGGEVFDGDQLMWEDCFFSNPTRDNVESFCQEMGWRVEITEGG